MLRTGPKYLSSQERALEENEDSTKFRTAQAPKQAHCTLLWTLTISKYYVNISNLY